ncbi:hypothetical protein [Frankia sp. Cas4]|uniref:hypothetical protein n=1 Tax=Frankia sp. Cas4 TaxID=3073927 RepID=UPI002AD49427|nr:hypothetical protein [Frankia sp. Cas4]
MSTTSEASRERILRAAGLIPLGSAPSGGGIKPFQAWKYVISGAVVPDAVVEDGKDDNLEEVDRQWWKLAKSHGVVSDDGSFLISVTGEGASLPWAIVRASSDSRLAQTLTAYPGEPEFVAMARDGHVVLGVTSEEDCTWLVCIVPKQTMV